jgi:energy-coupling factor transporter transmembrane protein EcfT
MSNNLLITCYVSVYSLIVIVVSHYSLTFFKKKKKKSYNSCPRKITNEILLIILYNLFLIKNKHKNKKKNKIYNPQKIIKIYLPRILFSFFLYLFFPFKIDYMRQQIGYH